MVDVREIELLRKIGSPMGDGFSGLPSRGEVPEPTVRVIRCDNPAEFTKIEVSVPTLIYPKRNDVLTGTGDLGQLRISYSRSNPTSAEFGWGSGQIENFQAGLRGSCYLYAPGTWWIRAHMTLGTATGTMEVWSVPIPDVSALTYFFFSRSATAAFHTRTLVGVGGAAGKILSIQGQLDGVQRLDLLPDAAARLRFAVSPSATLFLPLALGEIHQFEGNRLPLADVYVGSAVGSMNVRSVSYL